MRLMKTIQKNGTRKEKKNQCPFDQTKKYSQKTHRILFRDYRLQSLVLTHTSTHKYTAKPN